MHIACKEIALHSRRPVELVTFMFSFDSVGNKFVPVVTTKCFFVLIALISLILKFYPLFRVNFVCWEVTFPSIRVNLSRVHFKYLN